MLFKPAGFSIAVSFLWQPDPTMLRRLFEEELGRCRDRFGASDPWTAGAARDLGLFLKDAGPK